MLFKREHIQYLLDANGYHQDMLLDQHHFIPRSKGGKNTITNCVLIPRELHDKFHHYDRLYAENEIQRIFYRQQKKLQKYLLSKRILL